MASCGSSPMEAVEQEQPDILKRLINRKIRMTAEMDKLDKAITALQDNPEVAEVVIAISRLDGRLL